MKKLTNSEQNGEAAPVVDEVTPPEEKKVPAPAEPVAKPAVEPAAVATDPPAPEAVKPPEPVKPEDPPKPQLSRDEFTAIADKFGDAVASKVMRDGGDFSTAMALAFDATTAENEKLTAKIAELNGQPTNGTPIAMKDAKGAPTLFKTKK